jgi:hypothetical protein
MEEYWKRAKKYYNKVYGLPLLKKVSAEKKVNFIRDIPEGFGGY